MAVQGRPVLGIDINSNEICVIEMRGAWPEAQVVNVGKVATPAKSVEAGRIVEPSAVADALRGLLERMGVGTREAVFGIAECCVVTRILDIPAVPANELRTVIEGELAHYQILGNSTGAFDFMQLVRREGEAETGPQALVMAAEVAIVAGYRTVAEMSGLHLIALEPSLLALYRSGFSTIHSEASGVCLAVGRNEAEITVISQGQIRLYRRVDMGRDHLILDKSAGSQTASRAANPLGRMPFGEVPDEPEPLEAAAEQPRLINPSAASNLTVELQRSLDYYSSQNPDEANINRLVLVATSPELAPLEMWLSQSSGMETILAQLPAAQLRNPEAAGLLEGVEGMRFLCAAGLAMRELSGLPAPMPRFDLSSQQRNAHVLKSARRGLGVSLAGSIAAVLLGSLLALSIGMRANHADHELGHIKEDLAEKERVKQEYITSVQTQQDLLRSLKTQGFPFPRIMDSVTGAVVDKVGLTSVGLDSTGKLTVNGDAGNEKDVIKTLENLRKVPFFDSVAMDTFDKLAPTLSAGWLVRFQISCQLTSARTTASASTTPRQER